MKWIKYQYVCNILNEGTENEEVILLDKKIGYNEANLAIAQKEAYNGQYEIIEDEEEVKIETVPELYIVTFSGRVSPDGADKTFDEIYQAVSDGKEVVAKYPYGNGYEYYQLTRYTNTILSFTHTNNMSYGSILTDQYKTHFVQMKSDGTFKHYEFKLPQKPESYEEYAYNIFNLGNNTDAWQIDDVSYCYRHGTTIFVDFTITPIDSSVKTIEAKGTQSNLRGVQVPIIYINSDFAPIHDKTGSVQLYARCADVDRLNNSTTSMHALPAYITDLGDSFGIWIDSGYIMSNSVTEVEGFTIRGWWIMSE